MLHLNEIERCASRLLHNIGSISNEQQWVYDSIDFIVFKDQLLPAMPQDDMPEILQAIRDGRVQGEYSTVYCEFCVFVVYFRFH